MSSDDEIVIEINRNNKGKKKKKVSRISQIKKSKKVKIKTKKKTIFKIIMLSILIIIILILLASSEIFNVKEISVLGIDRLSENEIISYSEIEYGQNIFKLNLGRIEDVIVKNPYVENVHIERKLPNKININVDERKVKYMLQLAESYIYIDGQGYILEISREKQEVPILIGIITDLSNINPGDRLEKDDLLKLNTVNKIEVTAANYEILDFISKIDITDTSDYILYMESIGKSAYIGDATDLNTRILWIKAIIEKNENKKGIIFVNMDLNTKKPFFRKEG